MFFGMCNSLATFQAMMDDIFEDLIEEGIVIIYMDDMFLSAKMKEQLRERATKGKHQASLATANGKQFVLEAKEVRILQGKNRMVGNGHQRRENHHGSRKAERDPGMACPCYGQTSQRLPRILKLLSTLHLRVFRNCSTSQRTVEER